MRSMVEGARRQGRLVWKPPSVRHSACHLPYRGGLAPTEPIPRPMLFLSRATKGMSMGATTIGALVGAAIDGMSGDDGVGDGAVIGAVTANVLKVVLPLAITYAVGWAVLRGAGELKDRVFGEVQ